MVGALARCAKREGEFGVVLVSLLATLMTACVSSGRPSSSGSPAQSPVSAASWSDSVLRTMTLRQKVAQMVWPFMLGDYAATDSPSWTQLERLVTQDQVGGFIVSVGSPLDIATKTNALQRASRVPLLFSADFETGAGFRVRAGYFLPNAIDLGGATVFPLQMALGAIMTYHGILPALDSSGLPATLSPRILGGLLRDTLSYRGLLVTDAMDMVGVLRQFGAAEAARRAVSAGADVLLMPSDVTGTIDAVVAGVQAGRYEEQRIDASVRRLLELKRRFGLDRARLVSLDSVRRVVGDTTHAALARRVAERGVVLVKDSLRLVPMPLRRAARVLMITYARRSDLGAGVGFAAELRRGYDSVRSEFVSADDATPDFRRLLSLADSAEAVVLGSYVNISSTTATAGAPRAFVDFVAALQARNARVVLVSFGTPYLLQQAASVSSYMIAWGPSQASQQAAARALLGSSAITGKLPISIPPFARFGDGEQRSAVRTN